MLSYYQAKENGHEDVQNYIKKMQWITKKKKNLQKQAKQPQRNASPQNKRQNDTTVGQIKKWTMTKMTTKRLKWQKSETLTWRDAKWQEKCKLIRGMKLIIIIIIRWVSHALMLKDYKL